MVSVYSNRSLGNIEGEIWKDIPGYEGMYQVSNMGRVKSLERCVPCFGNGGHRVVKERIMSPAKHKGRYALRLSSGGRNFRGWFVHRLVMLAFVGPCPEGMEACHNDGDPTNNLLSNLRYDTRIGNMADKIQHGTNLYGESNHVAKLTESDVLDMRIRRSGGESVLSLAKFFNVRVVTIVEICTGQSWPHIEGPRTKCPARGERQGSSLLKEKDVIEIRRRNKNGESYSKLANAFGVGKSAISHVCAGRSWKHLLPENQSSAS